ncbi:MAG: UDP-2,3-diacylglucosamine diphosphatase [Bdellovibrionales bacterium]|nr:UDP-2,3-diacylglucosamine diphosphatase [Bdellovibrionales bacterium]
MQSPRARSFVQFLKDLGTTKPITHLFLLGDIFDLWIGDHQYFKDKFQEAIVEIRRLLQQGVQVHYFEGNHDLYLTQFWQTQLGATVYPGPALFLLDGLSVRVEHGDQMDPEDRGYLFLRWFLRTRCMRFISKVLPGPLVAKIGEQASHASRKYTTHTKTIDKDRALSVIRQHAKKVIQEKPFSVIVTGHVHISDDYQFEFQNNTVRSINLGSWMDHPFILKIENGTVAVENMNLEYS